MHDGRRTIDGNWLRSCAPDCHMKGYHLLCSSEASNMVKVFAPNSYHEKVVLLDMYACNPPALNRRIIARDSVSRTPCT